MYNHTPKGYENPFAPIISGEGLEAVNSNQEDIFYQNDILTAFVCSRTWPNNPGNVMVIPNHPYENLYDIPDDVLSAIHCFAKRIAIAMKELYQCDGTSIRQHNEPAGNQEVWHYHLHVFPRYTGDNLYQLYDDKRSADPAQRATYAAQLREYFKQS